jgi:hypothetical protein
LACIEAEDATKVARDVFPSPSLGGR